MSRGTRNLIIALAVLAALIIIVFVLTAIYINQLNQQALQATLTMQ